MVNNMGDVTRLSLNVSDDELARISEETGTGLSVNELKEIRDYFEKEGRDPTDIELQALGQAWSEHCCYKSSKYYLKKYLFHLDAPQNIRVIKEDAGLVEFDDDHAYAVALESHNHPSAIEPYGGAATGIGGILRDVVCMGAQPVALVDPIFFAPLTTDYDELPRGVKHPKFIFSGVVSGIRDYGNRVGIPTVAGMTTFHPGYLGNCLVNVGCIGIVKKDDIIYSRVGGVGDLFVLAGGGTGRDGIHGVTFASKELADDSETSSRSAVQVGDPIMKEPLIHACLEANAKKLLTGLKDLGGGGLSCVVGEMAEAAGFGAHIDLEKVHLKEGGMLPWEIWVSESQERMMMSVTKDNLDDVLAIFDKWDVPAVVIGEVTPEERVHVFWKGEEIYDMEISFVTTGPMYQRPTEPPVRDQDGEARFETPANLEEVLIDILSSCNIASKDWVIRQYDFEVRANTTSPSLVGTANSETHADAAVVRPVEGSSRGLAITSDVNPHLVARDPYWGAASAVDETVRNLAAVGARVHSFADCLNFGNPEKPEKMWEFSMAVQGLAFVAEKVGATFVSGNVSLYNEAPAGACPPTPTIMGIGIIEDAALTATPLFKSAGDTLYLIGETKDELGASAYYRIMGADGGTVPRVDPDLLARASEALVSLIEDRTVVACHDVSEGGIAIALSEMCLGSTMGASIELHDELGPDTSLFSESNTRWICEVEPANEDAFEKALAESNVPFTKIGSTGWDRLTISHKGRQLVSLSTSKLMDAWQRPLWETMG
ncbi:phosphoribosylformylglycinamidine synthase subunit PurL [archaeon]|nr:MAG: phosphoribosylformylglycinamidine synthase subunit PurL [archaeon]